MANFPIVGIGSSAGGLEALQKLFGSMPAPCGMGFVVVAHLDPTRQSHMAELLARCTKMPVVQIDGRITVEPDHVYVIAPDQDLLIEDGIIRPGRPVAPRAYRRPVDGFFRSLAEDQGERAVAIVLSGTGTNGSQGLRFIKAEGGIVLAQEPETAGFQGMPRSAIGTGVVDLVLPPEQMPDALLGLATHTRVRDGARATEDGTPEEDLNALLAMIRTHSERDFRAYKRRTLLRRIHRRMGLHRIASLGGYLRRLREDPPELDALIADLTINVTGFFRDPEAWEELGQKVIQPLVRERPNGSAIRVWVPGCSTGEEAYTSAMLVSELAEAAGKTFDLRVFATDVADGVLAAARMGRYPASVALDVGEKRLSRFFEVQDDSCFVRQSLRELITFAPQDLLQDPPLSRLDLISCRNLLIYLDSEFQKQVLALFHFALAENGHLFLGPAETSSGHEGLFQPVSKKWRIYRRVGPTRHDVVNFPLIADRDPGDDAGGGRNRADQEARVRPGPLMTQALLDRYAPASALIDARHRVQYLRGPVEGYLRPPSGEPSSSLLAMAREGLQLPLRLAVRSALAQGVEVAANARVRRGDQLHPVRLVVTPVREGRDAPRHLLVSFLEREAPSPGRAPPEGDQAADERLQVELDAAREDLRLTMEQMEAANEDLKASNEEIRSINEELQASNEELETSREELQSLNEELNTVNSQLHAKVVQLEERTADLNNLLNSTDVATLFLDRALCIRWFTPAMKSLFQLLHTDIGRPIAHFAQRFEGGDLVEDARAVLARLVPVDGEVRSEEGRWYIRHAVPYRTVNDRIDGVVISYSDITERKRWEEQVEAARHFAESIVDTVREPLLVLTPDLKVRSANRSFYEQFRMSCDGVEGRLIFDVGSRQWDIPELRQLLEEVLPEDQQFSDFVVTHEFEAIGRRTMLLNGRRLDHVQLILLAIEDVTERHQAEETLRRSEARFRALVSATTYAVYRMSPDWTELRQLDGRGFIRDVREPTANWMAAYLLEEDEPRVQAAIDEAIRQKKVFELEHRVRRMDGSVGWTLSRAVPLLDERGEIQEWFGAASDVTARKRAEERLLESEQQFRVLFDSIDQGFCVIEMIFDGGGEPVDYRFLTVNAAFQRQTGLVDVVGKTMRSLAPNHEQHWFETYGRIARTREPERFENAATNLGRYYEVYAFPFGEPDERKVGVLFNDIADRKRAQEALRRSEERLRKVLETDAVGVLFFDHSGTIIDCNDVFLRMIGYTREDVANRELTWRRMTPPEWIQASEEQMAQLDETGRLGPYEKECFHKDGSRSWILFAGADLADGTVVEFAIDISTRKQAEQERELLAHELSHRVKNVLAVVRALAMQTKGGIATAEQFRKTFVGRLEALARAHQLLLDTNWQRADLRGLVKAAVQAYCMDQPAAVCAVDGPPLEITAKQGLGLSLVLHELGTNAIKYGALSTNGGGLRISWQTERGDGQDRVRLMWEERGGPEVAPPERKGFGMRLIEQSCAYELDGEVHVDWQPHGLRCTISFPLG